MKRYFLITFMGKSDDEEDSQMGSIVIISESFPCKTDISHSIGLVGINRYSLINIFEFKNRIDYESFIGVDYNEN